MVTATAFRNHGVEVAFSGMTSLQNFIKVYQLVQKLMGGQTDRQDSDVICLHFSFRKESRLKNRFVESIIQLYMVKSKLR
jgi:hypothetical protein